MPDTKLHIARVMRMPATTLGDVRYWVEHLDELPDSHPLIEPASLAVDVGDITPAGVDD